MLLRLASLLALGSGIVSACDCIPGSLRESKRAAEIAFRGTIIELRDSPKGERVAVFRVNRVWKGPVTATIEMLALDSNTTDACFAFGHEMLNVGSELLVFGSTFGGGTSFDYPYLSVACATQFAKDAKDIGRLGRGWKPKSK